MKKISLIISVIILSFCASAFAQQKCYNIQKNDYESLQINFHFDIQNLNIKDVKTEKGMFSKISYADLCETREIGKPELPEFSKLIEIPLCSDVNIRVVSAEYDIYDCAEIGINHPIFPAQPSYKKSQQGPFSLVQNEDSYATNEFFGLNLAETHKVGIARDMNMGDITLCPISYNPVTNQIKLYTDITIEISYTEANIPATLQMKSLHGNGLFNGNKAVVINPIANNVRGDFESAPIKYLIVAHSMFRNNQQLNNFINWKKRIGYLVEIGYTDESNVGTTSTSIANFVKSHYTGATAENPAPTFLLLIGDHAQIPAFDSRNSGDDDHITDLYYACWTANDNIPDCFYGRFSAQNVNQLTPQIEKTLMYEQYTMPDPSYLAKAVAIAGTDSYWGPKNANWQIHYLTDNYLNDDNGYSTVYAHYYNCSSQASTIRQEIGAGVGYANYTAHGGVDGWSDPAFNNNQINSMNNANKYGLIIGNCCLTGKFEQNCFGEELLRANNKGALAYIGASNSSLWPDDYTWSVGNRSEACLTTYDANNLGAYDRLWHTHNEAHSNWYVTNGGIIRAGNMAVQSSTSTDKLYYWEIYHLFGDPSIKTYLGIPSEIEASVPSAMPIGVSTLNINAVPYAYVALTQNGVLISACFADENGDASLALPSTLIPGEYEVAISAQNHIQFFQTVTFTSPDAGFVVCNASIAGGSTLTNNSNTNWNLSLENLGAFDANNIYVKLSTTTPSNITLSTDSIYVGTIAAGQTVNLNNAYTAHIAGGTADQETANITLLTHFDNDSTNRSYNMSIAAPQLEISDIVINAGTANQGCINPGESGTITVTFKNSGHNGINNLQAGLASFHEDITIEHGTETISSINSGNSTQVTFDISVSDQAQTGSLYPMQMSIFNGEYQLSEAYRIPIGKVMEDFETGDFTSFDWNNGTYPWEITTSNVYAGTYSARSKNNLGDGTWGSDKESKLEITINVQQASPITYFRKVSSEAGYDMFSFSIDGSTKEELSGNVAWGQASFDVPVGTHTFRFMYSKDYSTSSGSDCAWIDNIVFPVTGQIIEPTSIENNEIDNQLNVYPNPAHDQLNIQCDNNMQSIEIIDIMGRSVKSVANIDGSTYSLNISNLSNAIYFVKVVDDNNQVLVHKIIKK